MPVLRSLLGISLFAMLSACAGQAEPAGSPPTSPQDDAALYDWLVGEEVATSTVLRVQPDQGRLDDVLADDPRQKVGVAETVGEPVEFSSLAGGLSWVPQAAGFGAIRTNGEGGFVWSGAVETPGATAIRLELTDVFISPGTELWVYGDAGEVFGPFTGEGPRGDGEFSVNTLIGEHAWLQVRHEGADGASALAATHFTIDEVGYLDQRFELGRWTTERTHCTSGIVNAPCVENADCHSPAVSSADKAVAEMLFRSGGSYYICTGGLIADTNPNSTTLLFLTAHHCISKPASASSLETYWDFSVGCGTTECTNAWATGRTTPGATLLSTSTTGDYSLLLLDQVPSGRAFLPFDATPIANSNGADLTRYSHPEGAPLAYSTHDVSTSAGTCGGLPRGTFIYSRDAIGATQGGSSGSPVLNAAGKVVGQLYGACGTNLNDDCDGTNNATVDGALAAYYPNVRQYLDPQTACSAEICTDGLDNDCDGLIDGADPNCTSSGCINPGGAAAGASCDANADCCSASCKGKPGAKTCR